MSGIYTLIVYYSCGSDTLRQTVNITQSCISVSSTAISCASLGSATVEAIAGIGPFSYTWMPTAQTNSVATGLSPGTYTVRVQDAGNGFTYTQTTTFVPVIPLSGIINNADSVTCFGAYTGTANVTNLAGGSGSEYFYWTNGLSTYTTAAPVNLSSGNWTCTVIDALTSCVITGGFFVAQPPTLSLTLNTSSPSACVGTSLTLSALATGGTPSYTYSWAAGPASSIYSAVLPVAGACIYSLSATDAYSCQIAKTITVTGIPNPILVVTSASICPLETGTLAVTGATTYSWNGLPGSSTFTNSPLSSTVYSLVGSALACTSTATGTITVKPVPTPTLTQNSPLCESTSFVMSAAGGTAYSWVGPQSFISSAQSITLNPVQLNQAGVYQVTLTAANSCTAPASTTLIVKPLPVVLITPNNPSICLNIDTVALVSSGTATLFNWSPANSLSASNTSSVLAFPASTTTFVLIGSLNSCTAQAYAVVNVVPPPSLIPSITSTSMCAQALSGSPNTIVLTASGASSYTISTPGHINNSNPAGPSSSLSLLPPYLPTGPETATLLGTNGVCTVSTTVVYITVPNPTLTISSPTPVICAGQSYTYTSSGASSYSWSASSPGNTLYTTGSVVVASPTINSVFSVVGDSLGCFSAQKTSIFTVNPLPLVTIDPNPAKVCQGSSVPLTASGTGTLYTWSPFSFLDKDSGAVVDASPPTAQNYTVLSSLRGCTATAAVRVMVLQLPTANILVSQQSVCLGDTISMTGVGNGAYTWKGPEGLSFAGPNITFNAFSLSYSGMYTLTVSDQNNCRGSATQVITIYSLPTGSFDPGLEACAPFCANIRFVPGTASSSITAMTWQVNGQSLSGNNFPYCVTAPGTYPITGTVRDIHNCAAVITTSVKAYPKPQADFSFNPQRPLEALQTVQFNNESKGAVSYMWIFAGQGDQLSLLKNPDYLFQQNGTYPVVLIANNQWQCSDTIIKLLTVLPDFAVYVPNTFTPNNDGLNDVFGPVFRGAKSYNISIFDRWGEKMFETNDFNKGWDGTYRGEPCKEDVYVWVLDVTYPTLIKDQQTQHKNGQVLLYR